MGAPHAVAERDGRRSGLGKEAAYPVVACAAYPGPGGRRPHRSDTTGTSGRRSIDRQGAALE